MRECFVRHRMIIPRVVLALLFLLAVARLPLSAEIAPDEYRNMQLSAPEHIVVHILSSKTRTPLFGASTAVVLRAEVVAVIRSETKLSVGDRITIRYESQRPPKRGWAGPRPIPVLHTREETVAFLGFDAEQTAYVPAARGASFEPLIPEY